MSRPLSRFTQADVTKLLKAAKGAGLECITIEVLPGDGGLKATFSVPGAAKEEPSALEAWKKMRAREKQRAQEPTLSDEEWKASLRASELSGRERAALEALYERRGRDVHHREIKGAGVTTQRSLEARGYATLKMDGDRFLSWQISAAGVKFLSELRSLPPHF